MPSYEEPVETAKDLIKRNIFPFYDPGGEIMRQFFASSTNPDYREISQSLVIPKTFDDNGTQLWDLGWDEYSGGSRLDYG